VLDQMGKELTRSVKFRLTFRTLRFDFSGFPAARFAIVDCVAV
jgi:hypothetical protein